MSIQHTIDDLNNYTEDNTVDPRSSIDEASSLLDEIRSQQQLSKNNDQILICARDHFEKWLDTNSILKDQRDEASSLFYNISLAHGRIIDASGLAGNIRWTSADALKQLHQNEADFEKLLANEALVNQLISSVRDYLNNSLVSEMNVLNEQYHDNTQKVRQDLNNLNSITDLIQEANAKCSVEMDEIRLELLPKVQRYQEELTERAKEYADLFKNTKDGAEVALRASSSHRNIVEAINDAKQSAQQAIEAVDKSYVELFDEDNSDNVIEKSLSSVEKSKNIEMMAQEEFEKLEGKAY